MTFKNLALCAAGWACVAATGAVFAADRLQADDGVLPREVVAAASVFDGYMSRAATIGARFDGPGSVADSVRAGAAYEPKQLEEGMLGYAALAALGDDRFVGGVERAAGHGEARREFARRLTLDPFAATRIDGAEEAAGRIDAALGARSAPLMSAALRVKRAAYDVQHQAWSKVMVVDAAARLAQVKTLSRSPTEAIDGEGPNLPELSDSGPVGQARDPATGYTQVEIKALALAAVAILGQAHDEAVLPLLTDRASSECLRMSKLNLYQCMAAAGPEYEDIFCLGQHAMADTSQCVLDTLPARPAGAGGAYASLASHRPLAGR